MQLEQPSGHRSARSTAVDVPPSSINAHERHTLRTDKLALPPSSPTSRFGWLGRRGQPPTATSAAGSSTGRSSKRSDSVALAQAEGGAFLGDIDGQESAGRRDGRRRGSDAMAYPKSSRPGLATLLSSWLTRRILILLCIAVICFFMLLGPSDRRKEVLTKANSAWGDGWDHAEDYWDKAGDMWSNLRNNDADGGHPSSPQHEGISNSHAGVANNHKSFGDSHSHAGADDQEPHVINLPPMDDIGKAAHGAAANEASILDAVRQKPALHTDKLKTTRCEKVASDAKDSHGNLRPLVQYAIMIDAGSTGSRVHVYRFNFCKPSPELEGEVFEMIQGGLSSFKSDAHGAASSLKPLLKTAMDAVPPSLRGCTPISVKATAGLRLLGADLSKNILKAVREMLETEYPFPIADGANGNGIEIMEGRDEGVFAWITVNYLLSRIGADETSSKGGAGTSGTQKVQTAAVMDLGGASTQIVFEPIYESNTQGMHPGEHVYELSNFGGRKYTLYQNSYLGYGLMEARKSINSLTYMTFSLSHPDKVRMGTTPVKLAAPEGVAGGSSGSGQDAEVKVPSPCFAEGRSKKVKVRMPGQSDEIDVTMVGTAGGFEACKRLVEVMMDKDAVCRSPPCSFGGVYQPSLMTAFAESPIVALSYFYDRLSPLGLKGTFTLGSLVTLARKVCVPPAQWRVHFGSAVEGSGSGQLNEALRELEDRPDSCLDLTFLTTLLRLGYELDDSRSITVAKKLGGNELGWCLGAQLQVLQDGILCKRR